MKSTTQTDGQSNGRNAYRRNEHDDLPFLRSETRQADFAAWFDDWSNRRTHTCWLYPAPWLDVAHA